MKKYILIPLIFVCMLCGSLKAQTVYISKTGEKYHKESCYTIKQGSSAIELSDALGKGYEACKICKPVQGTVAGSKQTSDPKPVSQSSESSSDQCTAKTKAGSRCKRSTSSSNGLCWQHGGN